jgi:hypothetical protein
LVTDNKQIPTRDRPSEQGAQQRSSAAEVIHDSSPAKFVDAAEWERDGREEGEGEGEGERGREGERERERGGRERKERGRERRAVVFSVLACLFVYPSVGAHITSHILFDIYE